MIAADDLLDALADRIAARVEERLRSGPQGWIAQDVSQLGRRRHIAAVRRRVAAGVGGAALVGRRALLSPEALEAELKHVGCPKVRQEIKPQRGSVAAELDRELRIVRGGRQ
jgi:hypothetical protein